MKCEGEIWTEAQRWGELHMQSGVLQPQAKELPEAEREVWNRSLEGSEGAASAYTLISEF